MKRILLVEDNETYGKVAEDYLASQGLEVIRARDYREAKELLDGSIDGVVTDLFFPEETGTGKTEFGNGLVEKITAAYRKPALEERVAKGLDAIREEIDLRDPTMIKYLTWVARDDQWSDENDVLQIPLVRQVIDACKEGRQDAAMEMLKAYHEVAKGPKCAANKFTRFGNYGYLDLMTAIAESEVNQPFGVQVALDAHERGIPSVIATSNYHHDTLVSPIYQALSNYRLIPKGEGIQEYRRPGFIDAAPQNPQKNETGFWKKAFSCLDSVVEIYESTKDSGA